MCPNNFIGGSQSIILLGSVSPPISCQLWTTFCLVGVEFFKRCFTICQNVVSRQKKFNGEEHQVRVCI